MTRAGLLDLEGKVGGGGKTEFFPSSEGEKAQTIPIKEKRRNGWDEGGGGRVTIETLNFQEGGDVFIPETLCREGRPSW